jgi:hypothetical protein
MDNHIKIAYKRGFNDELEKIAVVGALATLLGGHVATNAARWGLMQTKGFKRMSKDMMATSFKHGVEKRKPSMFTKGVINLGFSPEFGKIYQGLHNAGGEFVGKAGPKLSKEMASRKFSKETIKDFLKVRRAALNTAKYVGGKRSEKNIREGFSEIARRATGSAPASIIERVMDYIARKPRSFT